MSEKRHKGFKPNPKPKCHYPLVEVKKTVKDGRVIIPTNARFRAKQDFGWEISDIRAAYLKLSDKHFIKKENSIYKRDEYPLVIDYYQGLINGESIYTHFYIDDSLESLVINSFHKPD